MRVRGGWLWWPLAEVVMWEEKIRGSGFHAGGGGFKDYARDCEDIVLLHGDFEGSHQLSISFK